MKAEYLKLLGLKVLPIVKRSKYNAPNFDTSGALQYVTGNNRIIMSKRIVDEATKKQREENKNQNWVVQSIHADGTFTLRSEYGYEQGNVKRNDFRVLK